MTGERKGIVPDQWGRPDAREPRPNPCPDLEERMEAERLAMTGEDQRELPSDWNEMTFEDAVVAAIAFILNDEDDDTEAVLCAEIELRTILRWQKEIHEANTRAEAWCYDMESKELHHIKEHGVDVLLYKWDSLFAARWVAESALGPCWATPDGHVVFEPEAWMRPVLPSPPEGEPADA